MWSNDENVDPVGACIGPRGSRVSKIVDELGGEKIDIIKYSDDLSEFIAKALSPADVTNVEIIDEAAKSCRVTVPSSQLSLAIGNKGQNARLAARLTNWKIDIRSEEDVKAEREAAALAESEAEAAETDEPAVDDIIENEDVSTEEAVSEAEDAAAEAETEE